jgi:hypothetical protein
MPFDMEVAMNGLHSAGFIRKYEVDGEVYGDIPTFSDHQVVNAHEKKSDYPEYEDAYACTCITPEGQTKHMHARGEGKGREGNRKGKGKAPSDAGADASPIFITLPLAGGGEHGVTEADVAELSKLFPAVDVQQALREMLAWNNTNPTKRKTATGVRDHIRRWLAKIQNEGGSRGTQPSSTVTRRVDSPTAQRVESGVNAFRRAAIDFGATDRVHGSDGGEIPEPRYGGSSAELPLRLQPPSVEARVIQGQNGHAQPTHKAGPEILPVPRRDGTGVGVYGS